MLSKKTQKESMCVIKEWIAETGAASIDELALLFERLKAIQGTKGWSDVVETLYTNLLMETRK